MPTTILIADDHDIIRAGIKNILNNQPKYLVAGEAVDGQDTLSKVKKFKPDILLLDISMPKISGLDIIEDIHQISPKTKILIISLHKASAYVIKAFRAGIAGYLNKENAAEELLPALHKIVNNKIYLTSAASSYLIEKALENPQKSSKSREEVLTQREQEVLRLVAEGKTAKEIAGILYISRRTVENHKNSLSDKLGLHRTSDLIKYAIKHGIVDVDEY
ncbi:MAG: DNA-binding response regulator [Dehalococcoidia bacterium]|nr:MAG: DNA-binding response regulator [Dehalococcoidia bacterium]